MLSAYRSPRLLTRPLARPLSSTIIYQTYPVPPIWCSKRLERVVNAPLLHAPLLELSLDSSIDNTEAHGTANELSVSMVSIRQHKAMPECQSMSVPNGSVEFDLAEQSFKGSRDTMTL